VTQRHLDRLSSIDASFLHQEGPSSHMHIGGVLIFDGPAPPFESLAAHVRGRLPLVPRYRQKLAVPPLQAGRPLWVDDPDFNLEYHLRHTALPAPGGEEQLLSLAARIASQRLDRSKPLWETWLVEGLEGPRFALISKTHHALVDGISGVDLASVLLDPAPTPPGGEPEATAAGQEEFRAHREPSGAELVLAGAIGAAGAAARLALRGLGAARRPTATAAALAQAAEGLAELVRAGLNPAPRTPLNVPIGPHRRYAVVRQRLADYKLVKDRLGGTVNDVVLTVVSGALARWLSSRGVRTEGLELRALVPVSVRRREERGELGNRLTAMRAPLPVYIEDPVARLRYVRAAMDGLKESRQAVGAATLAAVNSLAPPTILAQASRLTFSTRLFNLLVTNIPGPQVPLYLLGSRLVDLFPVAFLPQGHALAVAVMSYDGGMSYGLLGDYDAMADLDVVADGLRRSLGELLAAARRAGARRTRTPRAGARAGTARPNATAAGTARTRGVRAAASATAPGRPADGPLSLSLLGARRGRPAGAAAQMRAEAGSTARAAARAPGRAGVGRKPSQRGAGGDGARATARPARPTAAATPSGRAERARRGDPTSSNRGAGDDRAGADRTGRDRLPA